MLAPVQRAFARYFKQVLGLQQDPQLEFSTNIVPVLVIQPLLDGREDLQWLETSLVVGAGLTGLITFTPAAGEQWDIKLFSAQKPTTVTVSFLPLLGIRPFGTALPAGDSYGFDIGFSTVNSTQRGNTGRYFDTPLVLNAGDVLQASFVNNDAVGATFRACVLRRIRTIN